MKGSSAPALPRDDRSAELEPDNGAGLSSATFESVANGDKVPHIIKDPQIGIGPREPVCVIDVQISRTSAKYGHRALHGIVLNVELEPIDIIRQLDLPGDSQGRLTPC